MSDTTIPLSITQYCYNTYLDNWQKGFWKEANLPTKLALIHGEVSEALEALRLPEPVMDKHLPDYTNFAVELADIVIRVFDLAGQQSIPLGKIIDDKLAFNKTREHKHGKLF